MTAEIAGSISALELRISQVEQHYVHSVLPLTKKVEQALSQLEDFQIKVMNQTREIQAVHEEMQLSARVQSNFRSDTTLRLEKVRQNNDVSQERSLTLCKSLAEQIVVLKKDLSEVTEHIRKTIASSYQQSIKSNEEWSTHAAVESEKQRVMFSNRFQDLQKLINQTNKLVNENIEELLKQSKQQRRKIDDFETNTQKFLMRYVSTVKEKMKDMQNRLDQLARVVAAEIRDRKQNQQALDQKLGEVESGAAGCMEVQKKEVQETYAFFAKQMEQILADTHKKQESKRVHKVISSDEVKAFEKRYAKDMETLFYLVASLGDSEISTKPMGSEDFMKKLRREEPLLQPTGSVKCFSPTKHIPLDITLSDSNSETCDAEKALSKFLQEGSPSNEKDIPSESKLTRFLPEADSVKEQDRPMSQMSKMSNLERKCTTVFAADDVNVAELFASGPVDPEVSSRLLQSNSLKCVGDLPTVESTQILRKGPVFLTPLPLPKRQMTPEKSIQTNLDFAESGEQDLPEKNHLSITQEPALSTRSQTGFIDLPALKSNREVGNSISPNAMAPGSVVLNEPTSEKRFPVTVLPAADTEDVSDTDKQLAEAEAALGLNPGFEDLDGSEAGNFHGSLPKSPFNNHPDSAADDLTFKTKPSSRGVQGTTEDLVESNDIPYEEADFETSHISDDPFDGLLEDSGTEVDDELQQKERPISSGAGQLEDIKVEETPNLASQQKKMTPPENAN